MTKQHTQPAPEANDDDLEPTSGMATALVRAFKSPIGHGTFIPPEVIEKVLTIKRDCEGYSLGIVGLRKLLEAHIEATTGMLLMTRQSEAGIRFLTPQEAVKHGHATVAARFDAAHRWHLKTQVCVEPYLEDLTNQEREVYRQEQHANARILLHAKEIRRSRAEESAIGDSDD